MGVSQCLAVFLKRDNNEELPSFYGCLTRPVALGRGGLDAVPCHQVINEESDDCERHSHGSFCYA